MPENWQFWAVVVAVVLIGVVVWFSGQQTEKTIKRNSGIREQAWKNNFGEEFDLALEERYGLASSVKNGKRQQDPVPYGSAYESARLRHERKKNYGLQ